MRKVSLVVVLGLLFASPLLAQSSSFTLFATYSAPRGEDSVSDFDGTTLTGEWDEEVGYGLATEFYFSERLSMELSAYRVKNDFNVTVGDLGGPVLNFTLGELEATPISAIFRFHPHARGNFDPYLGVGASYVIFGDFDVDDIEEGDIGTEFQDETAIVANAGAFIWAGPGFGVNVDVKYIPLEPDVEFFDEETGLPGTDSAEYDPLLVSFGLSFRF